MSALTDHLYQLTVLQCRLNALELALYPVEQHQNCFARQADRLHSNTETVPPQSTSAEHLNATDDQAPYAIEESIELVSIEPPPLENPAPQTDEALIPIVSSSRRKRRARNARNRRQAAPIPESIPSTPAPIAPLSSESEDVEESSAGITTEEVRFEDDIITDLGIETHPAPKDLITQDSVEHSDKSIVPTPKDAQFLEHLESSDTLFLDDLSAILSDIPDDLAEPPSPLELKPELDSLPSVLPAPPKEPSSETTASFEDDDQLLQSDEVMLDILQPPPLLHEDLDALSDQIDLQPDNMSLWLARAKLWHQKSDLAAAISDCYRATQLKKDALESQKLLEELLNEANIPQYRSLLLPK